MLTLYCPNCAKPNYYTTQKPNLCGFCGSGLSINLAKKVQTPINKVIAKKKIKPKMVVVDDDLDENDEIVELPDISNLEVEIINDKRQKLTFGELAKQRKVGLTPRPKENLTHEQFIESFKNEARGHSNSVELKDDTE